MRHTPTIPFKLGYTRIILEPVERLGEYHINCSADKIRKKDDDFGTVQRTEKHANVLCEPFLPNNKIISQLPKDQNWNGVPSV